MPIRTINKASQRNVKSPHRATRIPVGTTVVSSSLVEPTTLFAKPVNAAQAATVEAGSALKVVGYHKGWHKVETFVAPKTRGWISGLDGPTLNTQLALPTCDRLYTDFHRVGGKAFIGPVTVKDINQGYLGDCYLMAALTAIARCNPGAIKDSIRKGDEPGSYVITLRQSGRYGSRKGTQTIKIDNWFPTKEGRLLYAQGGLQQKRRFNLSQFENKKRPLWPAILEKAFATRIGGYNKIEGGYEGDIFEALTGEAANFHYLGKPGSKQNEETLIKLKEALRAGLPVAAATKSLKEAKMPPCLHNDHVYIPVGCSKNKVVLSDPFDPRETLSLSWAQFRRAFSRVTIAGGS